VAILPLHELIKALSDKVATEATLANVYNALGKPRLELKYYHSGYITVDAGTSSTVFSLSGSGLLEDVYEIYSSGIAPDKSSQRVHLDGNDISWKFYLDIFAAERNGYNTTGNYNVGNFTLRVHGWNTTSNVYTVRHLFYIMRLPFKNTLEIVFINDDTVSATMGIQIFYSLFAASKRLVLKMRGWKDPKAVRKALGLGPEHPVIIQRLGYYETEEEHPYREFLKDFPIRSDYELELKDGTKVKACTPKSHHIVAEVFVPENWSNEKVLDLIKPYKLVYEEVI